MSNELPCIRHLKFILEMPLPSPLLHEVRFILIKAEEEKEKKGRGRGGKGKDEKKEAHSMEPLVTKMKQTKQHLYNIYSC